MPPESGAKSRIRKRKRAIEPAIAPGPQPQPLAKRQKKSRQSRSRTPPEFWDNLSRIPLCRRALREFNRRTARLATSEPPVRSEVEGDLLKQLKRFARHGGPKLRDIRGYPAPEIETVHKMSSSRSRRRTQIDPSNTTSQTRPTTYSAKDVAFRQAIIDAGYYPHGYEYSDDEDAPIPNDLDEINKRLQQSRPSLSPSQFTIEDFRRFQRSNMRAATEADVMNNVFPIIRGSDNFLSGQNYVFNHLEPLANNISDPKPDYYNGSRPKGVNPQVREDLGKYIIPCNDNSRPLLPNFFMEAKGPTGSAAEMKLQIAQDLAAGARGMHKMQSYGQDQPVFDGNAYTYGTTYHSGTGTLQLYGMHPTANSDRESEYHTTQLRAFALTDNPDSCRQGLRGCRNLQDLAKDKRDEFIALANAAAARHDDEEEEEEDGKEEEDREEEEDGEEEEDEEDNEETVEEQEERASQYMYSFASPSHLSAQNEHSSTTDIAHPESDTSLDELQRDYYPPAKRSSRSGHFRRRKR